MSVFLGVFATLVVMEILFPRRRPGLSRLQRWPGAGVLFITGAVLGRLAVPAGLAGLALWADGQGIGLFNLVDAPVWLVGLVSLALMDLAVWAQHLAMHAVPVLWRMHRVHHADPHIDVVTALRFHPAEILVSLVWKAGVVIAFGIPAWAAFTFEIALNAFAQFNHANWALPQPVDRVLRLLVVTPDMHRVHHSTDHVESNRNFGFCLSVWDRLFRLYKAQPAAGHERMEIGQADWRTAKDQAPLALLTQPLKSPHPPSRAAPDR
ncbi:sterol desaturase family protein [Henriciella aquimarina]|uniref:sterol desaturase family protein n=1 Tax=Henriciella aquimarina TaxID=545261 RepID=UPI001F46411E|nr:sterol desaturase family protein [Henriciella aquimarina]